MKLKTTIGGGVNGIRLFLSENEHRHFSIEKRETDSRADFFLVRWTEGEVKHMIHIPTTKGIWLWLHWPGHSFEPVSGAEILDLIRRDDDDGSGN